MTNGIDPKERRLALRLLGYWRDLGNGERLPSEREIDPKAIQDMWPNCAILDVAGKETDPEFTYAGPALSESAGPELAGRKLSQAPADTLVSTGFAYFGEVLEKKVPICFGGEFINQHGMKVLWRSVILPLSDDGARINRLLCAANCRELAPP